MRKRKLIKIAISVALVLTFLLQPFAAFAASSAEAGEENGTAFDGYLFKMADRGEAQLFSELPNTAAEHVFGRVYWTRDLESIKLLNACGQIEYIEPNYIAMLFEDGGKGWPYEMMTAAYPAGYGLDGDGVRIAVIDSGCDLNNPDLQDARIAEGRDYADESSEMSDSVYHGTKVIQTIAGDDNGIGLTGIAPRAEIVPLKCFSASTGGTVKILSQAIRDAVDVYGCDVINMSWGLGTYSSTLHEAVQYAFDRGVILVAAAGNVTNSYPQGTKIYPAYYNEVISVSAIGPDCGVLASSQANDGVDVCAPGGSLPFVLAEGSVSAGSGTSYASPCIAAAAALMKQLLPSAEGNIALAAFRQRAVDLGEEGVDNAYGYGLIRMDELLGTKWSYYDLTEIDTMNYPRMLGWMIVPGGGRVLVTAYDEAGKQTYCRFAADGSGAFSFDQTVVAQADEVLVTYLNADYSVCLKADRYR